jgi:hypothetical protein
MERRAMDGLQIPEMDEVLAPFLLAADPAEEERALELLVRQAEPTIRQVIRYKGFSFPGASPAFVSREAEQGEDLYCLAMLRLLEQLHGLKASLTRHSRPAANGPGTVAGLESADSRPIRSFRGLTESIIRSLLNEHLRRKYPRRASLQNQLVYIIQKYRDPKTGKTRFALWYVERDRLCGFLEWLGRALALTDRYRSLREDPHTFAREALPHADPLTPDLRQLLDALLRWLNSPIELDDMVSAVAQLRGVEDRAEMSMEDTPDPEGAAGPPEPADPAPSPEEQALMRASLQQLWSEIGRLPPQQCAALLLNLTDHRGRGIIDLLPVLGIASLRQIAAVMEMPAEQLAQLWSSLPLEDQQIATLLNCPVARIPVCRWRARQKLEAAIRSAEQPLLLVKR